MWELGAYFIALIIKQKARIVILILETDIFCLGRTIMLSMYSPKQLKLMVRMSALILVVAMPIRQRGIMRMHGMIMRRRRSFQVIKLFSEAK